MKDGATYGRNSIKGITLGQGWEQNWVRYQTMRQLLEKLHNRGMAFAHDLLMVPVAWLGAYWLRFNLGTVPEPILAQALVVLPVVMVVQSAVFAYFGLYRGVWRFASMPDLVRIVKAVVVGGVASMVVVVLLTRFDLIPRSIFPMYGLLLLLLLGGSRFLYRWMKDYRLYYPSGKRVLIIGAGRAGEMLVRDLRRDPGRQYEPVAFVDDDQGKRGREVHGLPVVGPCESIPDVVKKWDIEVILIALPSATAKQMRRVVEMCEGTGVPFRAVPRMEDLMSGRAVVRDLREISIEDLLGREPVSLDWQAISAGLSGRTVLVSGGGGSIGAELCRQIARLEPAALVILESSEFNLYAIEMELRRDFPNVALHARLGDVTDTAAVEYVMKTYRPDVVFHAAAYKHVPMLQQQSREAVRNNVLGTRTLAEAADRHKCAAFVMISTDKAVNPTNIMGASKRVAEIYCQNLARHSATHFITVRFGNVLGSAGSVVPLFRKQIEAGGPVTVTHPDITRYFMTIPEACQLIMQAAAMGRGGEIFVLDMGEPIKIRYLAEQMIRLAGKTPGEDIQIVYTGLRPGEKLYEELFHAQEDLADTGHEKILLARYREVDWKMLNEVLDQMRQACEQYDEVRLRDLLQRLVPEFAEAGAAEERVLPQAAGANVIPFAAPK